MRPNGEHNTLWGMSIDPNWLYSTIAQSSAAIVAIVGGFITASVLTIMAEKRSLEQQTTEKKTDLSTRSKEASKLKETYEVMRVESFLFGVEYDLRERGKFPPFDALIKQYGHLDLDLAVLEREYTNMTKQRMDCRHFIEQNMATYDLTKYNGLEEWVRGNDLDISKYDFDTLAQEYDRYRNREEERQEHERELRESKERSNNPLLYDLLHPAIHFRMPHIPSVMGSQIKLQQSQNREDRLHAVQVRLDLLIHEISLLDNGISSLERQIANISYPPHLGWGVVVLAFLAAFGILFPTLMMTLEVFEPWSRWAALVTFFLGICGVFAFVIILLRSRNKP